jgi:hypothetical protein
LANAFGPTTPAEAGVVSFWCSRRDPNVRLVARSSAPPRSTVGHRMFMSRKIIGTTDIRRPFWIIMRKSQNGNYLRQ